MKKVIDVFYACQACKATGLYVGMAERDGAAVVCHTCNGSGKARHIFEYEEFESRKKRKDVEQVFQTNPGICIGTGKEKQYKLSDFGGMPYGEWLESKPFKDGMENRKFTCPAWWYQGADYKRKPDWKECGGPGCSFSNCSSFPNKAKCWERWDKEFGQQRKAKAQS
jgi:hypothetical protein